MSFGEKITNLFNKKAIPGHHSIPEGFSHLYNEDSNFTEEFYFNLAKTIIFTENIIGKIEDAAKINFTTILRLVNPIYKGKPFYTFVDTSYGYVANSVRHPFNYDTILKEALEVRTETILPKGDIRSLGKILEFDNDLTTYDGAACAEGGFVDEGDIPPLDTWFYVTKTKLYCWIPSMFVGKIEDAMAVEIFESYHWLEESDPFFNLEIFKRLT